MLRSISIHFQYHFIVNCRRTNAFIFVGTTARCNTNKNAVRSESNATSWSDIHVRINVNILYICVRIRQAKYQANIGSDEHKVTNIRKHISTYFNPGSWTFLRSSLFCNERIPQCRIRLEEPRVTKRVHCRLGFVVLKAVVMESSILWDIKPCSPLKVHRRFGGMCHLHFHGHRISQARNQRESRLCLLHCVVFQKM
jgi:hypothetical protein